MKRNSKPLLAALGLILLASPAGATDRFTGQLSIGGGFSSHPLGILEDDAAGYATQTVRLQWNEALGGSSWRLGYEGSAYEFSSNQSLDQMHHALGLEWFATAMKSRLRLSGGVQIAGRLQSGFYEPYNFSEATGYFAFKAYLDEGLLARGYVHFRGRRYAEFPEESFMEPSVQMELQRFLPSRTTIGATIGWGRKLYPDPASERVWETDGAPTTSLLRVQVNAAQGLSQRASLRASFFHRWSLEGFPYLVREDLFDSPILDAYASSGTQAATSLRILGPWQLWLEPGFSYARWDYGQIRFPGEDEGVAREDEIVRGSVAFERVLDLAGLTNLKTRVTATWREQSSSLGMYTLSGPEISNTFTWGW